MTERKIWAEIVRVWIALLVLFAMAVITAYRCGVDFGNLYRRVAALEARK